ncbi:hypothetical protein SMU40_09220 [Streptococcus mutans 15VF2]|nr:hypothetical protein SMU40_09220 [Streptococcus mutans 15VF2]
MRKQGVSWSQIGEVYEVRLSNLKYMVKLMDKDKDLKAEIQAIYDEHKGNYSYRRIHLELRNRGFCVNHKKVQRLMKEMGLAARIRRKRQYSSYRGEVGKKSDKPYSASV